MHHLLAFVLLSFGLIAVNGKPSHRLTATCVKDSADYIGHLERLLTGADTQIRPLCDGLDLMARIQTIPDWMNWQQETLNQYGGYWTFGSGVDVVKHYLELARDTKNKKEFVRQALYYVGFGVKYVTELIDGGKKSQIVIFDQKLMDQEWLAGTPNGKLPYRSFQPTWASVMNIYLPSDFQVCFNPDKGNGHTISGRDDCTQKRVTIPEIARVEIASQTYQDLTGCPREIQNDCKSECTFDPVKGAKYCGYKDTLNTENRKSTVACIDKYNELAQSTEDAILKARAFLEACMSFNGFFTGTGRGWSVVDGRETGTEYLVRGDIAHTSLGATVYPLTP